MRNITEPFEAAPPVVPSNGPPSTVVAAARAATSSRPSSRQAQTQSEVRAQAMSAPPVPASSLAPARRNTVAGGAETVVVDSSQKEKDSERGKTRSKSLTDAEVRAVASTPASGSTSRPGSAAVSTPTPVPPAIAAARAAGTPKPPRPDFLAMPPPAHMSELTTRLADAQFAQALRASRLALPETYRLRHGVDPPAEMRILETSALERSMGLEKKVKRVTRETWKQLMRGVGMREEGWQPLMPTDDLGTLFERTMTESVEGEERRGEASGSGSAENRDAAPGEGASGSTGASGIDVSPVSPNSPDEIITPHDAPDIAGQTQIDAQSSQAGTSNTQGSQSQSGPSQQSHPHIPTEEEVFRKKMATILRHDGHIASHVSGQGGNFMSAYDGRSYLPDDAEPDIFDSLTSGRHGPRPPIYTRSGWDPALNGVLPQQMRMDGPRWDWDPMVEPMPEGLRKILEEDQKGAPERLKERERMEKEQAEAPLDPNNEYDYRNVNWDTIDDVLALWAEPEEVTTRNKEGEEGEGEDNDKEKGKMKDLIFSEEEGTGWGFVEGGSHGPLPMLLKSEDKKLRRPPTKLSTEKKNPPKMACLFCRNRKIACGVGKGANKTCKCVKLFLYVLCPPCLLLGLLIREK